MPDIELLLNSCVACYKAHMHVEVSQLGTTSSHQLHPTGNQVLLVSSVGYCCCKCPLPAARRCNS
jgi:hypothetical protein